MPEIPDIEVFSRNLKTLLTGKQVAKVNVVNGKKLKDKPTELSAALEGQKILDVCRSEKNCAYNFRKTFCLAFTS